jgi:hypothetical protein
MMEWTTIITNMPTIAPIAAGFFALYQMAKSEFAGIKNDIAKMDDRHREDNILMDAKHREDVKSHREDIKKMDEKWAVLFEKYLSK